MGTRATIRIVDADEERWLYGYPDNPDKDVSAIFGAFNFLIKKYNKLLNKLDENGREQN